MLASLGGRLFDTGFCDRHAGVERHCLNTRDCSIRPVLSGLQQAVDQVLGELTLASLLPSESEVTDHPAPARCGCRCLPRLYAARFAGRACRRSRTSARIGGLMARDIRIALVGFGNVGRRFAEQLRGPYARPLRGGRGCGCA